MKLHYSIYFALLAVLFARSPASASGDEVGRLTVLSSVTMPAFTIERDGRRVTSESATTFVRQGDVLIPDADTRLLLSPDNIACDEMEITIPTEVSVCPDKNKGLGEMVYDLVADRYLAASSESAGMYATRGSPPEQLFSLRPEVLRLFVDAPADSVYRRDLSGLPFLRFAAHKSEADAVLHIPDCVILEPLSFAGEKRVFTAGEMLSVRSALLDMADFLTLARMKHNGLPPGLECSVVVRTPAASGALPEPAGGHGTTAEREFSLDVPLLEAEAAKDRIIGFTVHNHTSSPWYLYIVNYTAEGNILSLYPPADKEGQHTALAAGASADLSDALLALESQVEYVLIAVSKHKLDIRQAAREKSGTGAVSRIIRNRYAPENSFSSALLVLKTL
jgi:hypothetical protein